MARLKAGLKPVPAKDRQAIYKKELLERGGHRLGVNLEADAHEALRKVMARVEPPLSEKMAVSEALMEYARSGKGKKITG